MKPALIESMHRIVLPKYVIRVWRNQPVDYVYSPEGVTELDVTAHANQELGVSELAAKIGELPNVNAVEVLDWNSNGVVFYNNW